MSDDLLERLRTYYGDDVACRMLLMEARHAIERLTAEIGRLKSSEAHLQSGMDAVIERNKELIDERDEAKAEAARLREALTRLRDCDWVITLPDMVDAVREIARAALRGEEG